MCFWQSRIRSLIPLCTDKSAIAKLHAAVIFTGFFTSGKYTPQLISAYAKSGHLKVARKLFDEMPLRTLQAWNAIVIAYSRSGFPKEVLRLHGQMILEGIKADSSSFTVAIKACTSLLDVKTGEEIWRRACKYGFDHDVFVGSSALNLYAKCGRMEDAKRVFDGLLKKDMVCWTTMITGFSQRGYGREAIDVFRRMQEEGVEGDRVVMLSLIQACADVDDKRIGLSVHGCLMRRNLPMDDVVQTSLINMYAKNDLLYLALRVFERMSVKNVVSWSTMIFGFAQDGCVDDALEMLIQMQVSGFEPDLVALLGALLACAQGGYLKMGRSIHCYVLRRQEGLEPASATSVIDMYAKCGELRLARKVFDGVCGKDVVCWSAMIAAYGIHGCGEEALAVFEGMVETGLEPDDATFAALISGLSHSGLVEEGEYWFDQMVKRFGIEPREKHYVCAVDLLARAGRLEEAYELVRSLRGEAGIRSLVALLSGCRNHGRFLIGEAAARKILEMEPDDPGVYSLVANFFADAKKFDEVAEVRMIMKKVGMKKIPGYSR